MKLSRAIAISLVVHATLLVVAHLRFDPTGDVLEFPSPVDSLRAKFIDVERRFEPAERERFGEAKKWREMDLSDGLQGAVAEAEPEPDDDRERERSQPSENDESEPKPAEENREEPEDEELPEPEDSGPEEAMEPVVERESETAETPKEKPSTRTETDRRGQNVSSLAAAGSKSGSPAETGAADGEATSENGTGGTKAGGGEKVDRGKLLRGYAQELYRKLAREKSYPSAARRAGLEGEVVVEVRIDSEGEILSVDLHESSGHGSLDRAALEAVRSLKRFPAPPSALAWNKKRLQIPIRYRLDQRG